MEKNMRLEPVRVIKDPYGDTRTTEGIPTYDRFEISNLRHILDVRFMMESYAKYLNDAGKNHDFTKRTLGTEFYKDFVETINNGDDFTKKEWYQNHINTERHHLNSKVPDDVNLFDVLEMIADCVCAGKARSGNVYPIELSNEILQKAFKNTVDMTCEAVEIMDDTKK